MDSQEASFNNAKRINTSGVEHKGVLTAAQVWTEDFDSESNRWEVAYNLEQHKVRAQAEQLTTRIFNRLQAVSNASYVPFVDRLSFEALFKLLHPSLELHHPFQR